MNIDVSIRKKIILLMKSFLEEHEIIPPQKSEEWRSSENKIDTSLKKGEKILVSRDFSNDIQGDLVVFIILGREDYGEPQGFDVFGDPLQGGDKSFSDVHTVVIAHTIQDKIFIESHKRELVSKVKKYVADICEKDIHISKNLQVYHISKSTEKKYSVTISERIGALHYPAGDGTERCLDTMGNIATNIYIAKLWDIVKIFGQLGDELFNRNVRYHVDEAINVEIELKKTLGEHPEDFFFYNNGIAIELMHNNSLDERKEHTIGIKYSDKDSVSVINGAQTISTAADFFYQQDSAIKEKIECAKEKAYVLLRVIYPEGKLDAQDEGIKKMSQISIALNRQKPIKPTDIQYDCLQIININQLYDKRQEDYNRSIEPFLFYCNKRGEQSPGLAHYELADLGRAIMAYYHNVPGEARSKAIASIVRNDPFSEDGNNAQHSIYAPFSDEDDFKDIFMQWYSPVNFTMSLIKLYDYKAKSVKSNEKMSENQKIILTNGKYFFAAWVVNQINDEHRKDGEQRDFSDFPYGLISRDRQDQVTKYIAIFISETEKCAATYLTKKNRNILSPNDFKTEDFYSAWYKYAQNNTFGQECVQYFEELMEKSDNS